MYCNHKPSCNSNLNYLDELMQKAVAEIPNLELTPSIIKRFGWNEKALQALDERPRTWVHLAVLQVVGEEDLVADTASGP